MKLEEVHALKVRTASDYEPFVIADGWLLEMSVRGDPALVMEVCQSLPSVEGFEAGVLAVRLSAKPQRWRGAYHVSGAALLARVAMALGYEMRTEPAEHPGYIFGEFRLSGSHPAKCCERDHDGDGNCDQHPGKHAARMVAEARAHEPQFINLMTPHGREKAKHVRDEGAIRMPFVIGSPVTLADAVAATSGGRVTPEQAEEHIRTAFKELLERVFSGAIEDGTMTEEQVFKVLTRFTEVIGEMSVQHTSHGES